MDTQPDTPYRPSRWDAVGIVLFIALGAAIAVWTVVGAVLRIVEVFSGAPIPVLVDFVNTTAPVPMGPGGEEFPVLIDRGWVQTADLPTASVVAAVLEPVLFAAGIVTAVVCMVLLSLSLLRGRVFSRTNTALATGAGLSGIIAFALSSFFGNMVANGAVARISEYSFQDAAILAMEPFPLLLGAFALAIVGTVFIVGDRLQRETAGLV